MADGIKRLKERVDEVLKDSLGTYIACVDTPRCSKVVQDPIHGAITIKRHELLILDSPVMQRLRRVHQTSASSLTYPTSHHTRFEHCVGAMAMAERMARALCEKDPDLLTPAEIDMLRVAALLHDAGHGPFSHLAEEFIREMPGNPLFDELKQLKNTEPFAVKKNSPAEILTFYMITSEAMQGLFARMLEIDPHKRDIDAKQFALDVAFLIIGNPFRLQPDKHFIADMITGPADADKLDYIVRDNHYTGLHLVVDVDRLLYSLEILSHENRARLCVHVKGIVPYEQIVVSKAFLTTALYHHQKVRASDCVVKGLFEVAVETDQKVANLSMADPASFLRVTDYDLLSPDGKNEKYKLQLNTILNRDLPKRMLCISPDTIRTGQGDALTKLKAEASEASTLGIRTELAAAVSADLPKELIWLDFPRSLKLNEAEKMLIRFSKDNAKLFKEMFPVQLWETNYLKNLYRGHLFAPVAHRAEARKAGVDYLRGQGIELNNLAVELCG